MRAALCQVAQREGRFDVGQCERVAVEFVKGDLHLHEHLDARLQGLTRSSAKVRRERGECLLPDGGARFGHKGAAFAVLLYQFQVAVARRAHVQLADFSLYPVPFAQGMPQHGADACIQFKEAQSLCLGRGSGVGVGEGGAERVDHGGETY